MQLVEQYSVDLSKVDTKSTDHQAQIIELDVNDLEMLDHISGAGRIQVDIGHVHISIRW